MSSVPAPASPARRALFALVVVSLLLVLAVMAPIAKGLFLAAVLAGALYPMTHGLARKLRGRISLAAGVMVVGVVLLLLGPVTGLAAFAIGEVTEALQFVASTIRSEGMVGLVDALPGHLGRAAGWLLQRFPLDVDQLVNQLNEQVGAQGGKAAAAVSGLLSATGSFVFQAVLMLIALYFLLIDGAVLVSWLERISPLAPGQLTEIMREFRRTSVAVMVSSAATAGVQALAAMVGYFIARVPHPLFFTTLTFFIAFVPAVGAAGVVLAAAVLLLATGHTVAAIFLAIWGVTVVGLIDNVIKPILVKRGMDLNGVVVFFSLIGGLAAFGGLGLLLGPLAVAFFLAVIRIWHRSYGKGPAAAEAASDAISDDDGRAPPAG